MKPRIHRFCETSWPESSKEPPASSTPELGLQVCVAMVRLYTGFGDQTQVSLMLVQKVLNPLSRVLLYSPGCSGPLYVCNPGWP